MPTPLLRIAQGRQNADPAASDTPGRCQNGPQGRTISQRELRECLLAARAKGSEILLSILAILIALGWAYPAGKLPGMNLVRRRRSACQTTQAIELVKDRPNSFWCRKMCGGR